MSRLKAAVERLRALASHHAAVTVRTGAAPAAIDAAERELRTKLPAELRELYLLCDGFRVGSRFAMVPIADLSHFAALVGEEPTGFYYEDITGENERDHLWRMDRLRVFDVLDGSFLSCVTLPDGRVRWLDDFREEPQKFFDWDLAAIVELAGQHFAPPDRVSAFWLAAGSAPA